MYQLLVIDDEPLVRRGIVSLIPHESLGIDNIYEASNGVDGLSIAIENAVDIVLCDINMPKMNGLEFSEKLKKEKPWVKIAIITGYDYFEYAKNAVKIGVEDYVLKPISKKDVIEIINRLVDKRKEDDRLAAVYRLLKDNEDLSMNTDTTGYKLTIDQYFRENITNEELSLGSMASYLGLSESHLSTVFKKIYGVPYQEYVLTQRLEKAKLLILSSDMKNYEIAEAVGIGDPNYFSTLFKKKFGKSPNQFKKDVR